MATQDRAGNAYGSPAKSATNAQRIGSRDAAGGGVVARYSAATRKATPLSSAEQTAARNQGIAPDVSRGSQTAYKVSNQSTRGYGETMSKVRSDYKTARKGGFTPDQAREQALSKSVWQTKMVQDAHGNEVR